MNDSIYLGKVFCGRCAASFVWRWQPAWTTEARAFTVVTNGEKV